MLNKTILAIVAFVEVQAVKITLSEGDGHELAQALSELEIFDAADLSALSDLSWILDTEEEREERGGDLVSDHGGMLA